VKRGASVSGGREPAGWRLLHFCCSGGGERRRLAGIGAPGSREH
jgi:hypothetical protein